MTSPGPTFFRWSLQPCVLFQILCILSKTGQCFLPRRRKRRERRREGPKRLLCMALLSRSAVSAASLHWKMLVTSEPSVLNTVYHTVYSIDPLWQRLGVRKGVEESWKERNLEFLSALTYSWWCSLRDVEES